MVDTMAVSSTSCSAVCGDASIAFESAARGGNARRGGRRARSLSSPSPRATTLAPQPHRPRSSLRPSVRARRSSQEKAAAAPQPTRLLLCRTLASSSVGCSHRSTRRAREDRSPPPFFFVARSEPTSAGTALGAFRSHRTPLSPWRAQRSDWSEARSHPLLPRPLDSRARPLHPRGAPAHPIASRDAPPPTTFSRVVAAAP